MPARPRSKISEAHPSAVIEAAWPPRSMPAQTCRRADRIPAVGRAQSRSRWRPAPEVRQRPRCRRRARTAQDRQSVPRPQRATFAERGHRSPGRLLHQPEVKSDRETRSGQLKDWPWLGLPAGSGLSIITLAFQAMSVGDLPTRFKYRFSSCRASIFARARLC